MKKSTMIALGCGAGAVACIALAVHFKKRRQTGGAVACGIVGGCAAVVAAGAAVRSAGRRRSPGWSTGEHRCSLGRAARQTNEASSGMATSMSPGFKLGIKWRMLSMLGR